MAPSFSIVTPSFNQAQFLERTIRSVLDQKFSNLEYLVLDGGSTDGSKKIIESYSSSLSYWRSEKDSGQFSAIEEGFSRSTGEIMAWINSDDMYLPWTFQVVARVFEEFPQVEWVTSNFPLFWDQADQAIYCSKRRGFNGKAFLKGAYLLTTGGCIQQESTFWRRTLWERAGARMASHLSLAGDFELWARFFRHGASLHALNTPLAGFRFHPEQKTAGLLQKYEREALSVLDARPIWLNGLRAVHRWVKPGARALLNRSLPFSPKLSLDFNRRHEKNFWHIRR